jgi:hypothetical protein
MDFSGQGLSFTPGLGQRFRNSLNGQLPNGVSEALQVLSLRLPQFLGGNPIAPDSLLRGGIPGAPPPIVGSPPQAPPPSPNFGFNQPTPSGTLLGPSQTGVDKGFVYKPAGSPTQSTPTGPSPAVSATPGVDRGFVYTPPSPIDQGPTMDPGAVNTGAPPNPNWIFQRPGAAPAPAPSNQQINDMLSQLFGPVASPQYDPGSGFDNRTGSPQI